jgi:hypothetical protein
MRSPIPQRSRPPSKALLLVGASDRSRRGTIPACAHAAPFFGDPSVSRRTEKRPLRRRRRLEPLLLRARSAIGVGSERIALARAESVVLGAVTLSIWTTNGPMSESEAGRQGDHYRAQRRLAGLGRVWLYEQARQPSAGRARHRGDGRAARRGAAGAAPTARRVGAKGSACELAPALSLERDVLVRVPAWWLRCESASSLVLVVAGVGLAPRLGCDDAERPMPSPRSMASTFDFCSSR